MPKINYTLEGVSDDGISRRYGYYVGYNVGYPLCGICHNRKIAYVLVKQKSTYKELSDIATHISRVHYLGRCKFSIILYPELFISAFFLLSDSDFKKNLEVMTFIVIISAFAFLIKFYANYILVMELIYKIYGERANIQIIDPSLRQAMWKLYSRDYQDLLSFLKLILPLGG